MVFFFEDVIFQKPKSCNSWDLEVRNTEGRILTMPLDDFQDIVKWKAKIQGKAQCWANNLTIYLLSEAEPGNHSFPPSPTS